MRLIIRADASTQIGTGHIMRCLALTQAWQDAREQATFATCMEAPALYARLQSEGMEVVHLSAEPGSTDDAMQTAALARKMGASWIVVDGYHFGSDYQRIIKNSGVHLLFVDDMGHAEYYCADVVLNQNIYAHEGFYLHREPHVQLLLGTRYALLRREFLPWCRWKRQVPERARKVLITLGGADPDNVTFKAIQALQRLNGVFMEAQVLVGSANPHLDALREALAPSALGFRLLTAASNMPELMAWADVAVSAGGSTCWELAFMGLPNLMLVLALNQEGIATGLEAQGVALNMGWHEKVSASDMADVLSELMHNSARRQEMSERGRQLVDSCGASRVTAVLRGTSV